MAYNNLHRETQTHSRQELTSFQHKTGKARYRTRKERFFFASVRMVNNARMRRPLRKTALGSIVFAGAVLALAVTVEAQQPKKIRIGYLSNADAATDSALGARAEGIRLALRELGYIEGQNIAIEYRYAEGRPDREPGLAAELVRLKVDLIVVPSGDATIRAAKNATKTIPIVMAGLGSDPVTAGHVESLARPGSNVTGFDRLLILKLAPIEVDHAAVWNNHVAAVLVAAINLHAA
jgi:hypothetical protein